MLSWTLAGLTSLGMALGAIPGSLADAQNRQTVQRSCQLQKEENWPEAVATLLPLHESMPGDYVLNLRLGWLHYLSGKYDESQGYYKAAAQASPESLEARLGCLLPLLAAAKYQEAEAMARRIDEADPKNYFGNLRLAVALRGQGKYDAAQEIVRQMLVMYPADVYFRDELAQLDAAQSRTVNSLTLPAAVDAQIREAVLWSSPYTGNLDRSGAKNAILAESQVRPQDYSNLRWRLQWVHYLGRHDGERFASWGGGEIVEAIRRSCQCEEKFDYAGAVEALRKAYGAYPRDYALNLRLGWLYYLFGDHRTSEQYYYTAIKRAPQATEAGLGYLLPLLAKGRYQDAESLARQILAADPGNYYGNLRLAVALRSQRKFDEAEKTLQPMLKTYPADVLFLCEAALLSAAQDRKDRAKDLFLTVLALDPGNPVAAEKLKER